MHSFNLANKFCVHFSAVSCVTQKVASHIEFRTLVCKIIIKVCIEMRIVFKYFDY